MNENAWRAERDSRSLRYAGRVLDSNHWILIRADPAYASRYDGQVAILTAVNLLGRMTPALALDIPAVPMVAPLPWAGQDLRDFVMSALYRADPYGRFKHRTAEDGDYVIYLGRKGAPVIAHGSGWNVYIGPERSPLPDDDTANPIGPALSAILTTTEAFKSNLEAPPGTIRLNALNWCTEPLEVGYCPLPLAPDLGAVWTVGTGSVGTAILYFLTLATQRLVTALFDMDTVKIHNLDRSPIFTAEHIGWTKVAATQGYLNGAGVMAVQTDPRPLDESAIWRVRENGVPDIVIAAANERNVRSVIEQGFPPVQIYGTTGKNWQAAVIRHVPLEDPCSCCGFPETAHVPTACATGKVGRDGGEVQIDAALPFLSFAAGAMAAAEILKLGQPGHPFSANRVILNTCPAPRTINVPQARRAGCICEHRSAKVHQQMIAGSRFAGLSGSEK